MHADKVTCEAHTYTVPDVQFGCFMIVNTQENMLTDKLTGEACTYVVSRVHLGCFMITRERIFLPNLVTLNRTSRSL